MPKTPEAAMGGTRSLGKALRLLNEVAAFDTRGARLTDLVSHAALEPSTAHRMLRALVAAGLVEKDARNRYHLGRQVFELGLLAAQRFDVRDLAAGPLRRVADATGDVAFLTMRSGLDMVCVDRREGSYPIQVLSMTPGMRRPIGFGAGGLALLAAMPKDEADAILKKNELRLEALGTGVAARVRRNFEEARRDGFGVSESHLTGGIGGIGMAVPTSGPVPFVSVSVVAISSRFTPRHDLEIREALRLATGEIAEAFDRTPEAGQMPSTAG